MPLSLYNKKRNFKNTPEPDGVEAETESILSFVVQKHNASHLHYDFRLQMEGVLKSWAVPKGPSMVAGEKRLAVMVEDHPLPYGKFFGEIPKGNYGAGTVEIWDSGTYEPMITTDDAEKSLLAQLQKGDLKFIIHGTYLQGSFALVRMNDGKDKNWLLIKKQDEYAKQTFDIESIISLKSKLKKTESSAKSPAPKRSVDIASPKKDVMLLAVPQPMLAKQSRQIMDNAAWLYEMKYDGYRVVSKIINGHSDLFSRNGNSYTKTFQSITDELNSIAENVILDGEVVIENKNGISDFQLLQNYQNTKKGLLKYYVFDIIYLNGHDITNFPLLQRKELLTLFFENYNFKNIFKSTYQIGDGKKLFEQLSAKGYEGVIAKEPQSSYLQGKRTDSWLKIKTTMAQEAIICGYTEPQNSRKYFGSIILGMYDGNDLKYIGNCGTGFTEASLKELRTEFENLKIPNSPISPTPKLISTKGKPYWIKPELVCNIKFLEWTQEEHLRNPVFMGLRNDKKATEVINESAVEMNNENLTAEKEKVIKLSGKEVKCTNLNKIYFPEDGYTKGDLIHYYQSISKYILPYLKNRPQSLNRHPNGIMGESFYQKDMESTKIPSWAKTVKLHSKSNDAYIDYLICNDVATLIYMANLGCIEINPWSSTFTKPDEPTYMILDLDPGEISFLDVVDTALVIKELCDSIYIPSYCKTSGATGLHIYIPLFEKYNYDDVKTFAEIMATIVHQRLPDTTSIERSVAKRKDKIYIDFLQNRKGQTIAAPYSVRPRAHATVSTPLLWEEVNHQLSPAMFTIKNMEKRLSTVGDLWKPVLQKGVTIEKALKALDVL